MLLMAVTRTIKNYFVVWTSNGMIIDETYFDNEFWCSMKNKFQNYYEHFFKVFYKWVESYFYLGILLFGIKTFSGVTLRRWIFFIISTEPDK